MNEQPSTAQMRMCVNSDGFLRVVGRNVFEQLLGLERLACLVVAKQPQLRRLIVFVVGDAEVVGACAHDVVVAAARRAARRRQCRVVFRLAKVLFFAKLLSTHTHLHVVDSKHKQRNILV